MLSNEEDVVLDPFCGRGTTLLEARLTGRYPLASDLNPIAVALAHAKNTSVSHEEVITRIDELARGYDPLLYVPEAQVQSDDIQLIFHPRALAKLCYLRRRLLVSTSDVDRFLVGAVLGVMHGAERQDGSSGYASISMPNTFSMSPDYVRRYVETNRLQRVDRDVFHILREKAQRLFKSSDPLLTSGRVVMADAKEMSQADGLSEFTGRVDLVLTSPPYLGVVNYARQNWIRSWFLGQDPTLVSSELDDNLPLIEWLGFMDTALTEMRNMLRPGGTAVLVIGDVAKPGKSAVSLARELLRRVIHSGAFEYVGCVSDHIETETKTTRIWRETKGRATSVDRLIVLSDRAPDLHSERLGAALFGDPMMEAPRMRAEDLREYAYAFAG